MGQPVEDVTTHPALAGCAQSVANVYDWQHDATHHELLTMPSPTTGQPVSLAYLLPESVDDLSRQRHMYEFLVRQAGGVAARLPQHLATVAIGLYDMRHRLGDVDPAFAERVTQYFEHCRENDYSIATIFSDPLHHRHYSAAHPEPLHVVATRADGIVVRGARGVGTQSPYANELLCLTSPQPNRPPEEMVFFAAPVNTEGIHIWDYTCDAFGSRQLLFEMYNVGSLATNKQRLASAYDTSACVALVKELAGITRQTLQGERDGREALSHAVE
ncbi:MAG: hypothetical protein ETSY2_07530 [Candidatus Entotheonella gemina]|uniref:HpaB/PvcC/4-BUDH N-terminal domain-containing protein n=1 Tax=Candidatus Entotheonella gemina TaxID=1429439 RepID=W4MCY6_9BACT|nr:MAG: hypothetical protein ETSY2_07530 [Candidatus Entotheonella gemina]